MSDTSTTKRLRKAARIILVNPQGQTLLFRYDVPGRAPFWVTPGGECDPGESFDQTARRELLEETGIDADPGAQILQMEPEFITVEGEPVRADERFYFVRTEITAINTAGHTETERELMTQHRWFTMDELSDWPEAIFPDILRSIIEQESQA